MIGYLVLVLDVSCIAFGYIQKNIPIYPKFWIYRISLMCIYILILFWTYAIIFLYIENFLDILNDIFLYVQSKYFLPYILENTKTPMCKHWEPFYFSRCFSLHHSAHAGTCWHCWNVFFDVSYY